MDACVTFKQVIPYLSKGAPNSSIDAEKGSQGPGRGFAALLDRKTEPNENLHRAESERHALKHPGRARLRIAKSSISKRRFSVQ